MCNIPGVIFGFCYIPPSDLQYYSLNAFSHIEEKLSEFMYNEYIMVGDTNARFGKKAKDLLVSPNTSHEDELLYPVIVDDVNVPNDMVRFSQQCAENSMIVVNNLKCK